MGAVSPGDSNQKIMGSFRFGIALLVLVSVVTAKDVFRYDDEKTGQSHYMTGDPGASVEGGWAFTNPDGTFELVYKADEGGFQPAADHIPVAVEDTNDVTEAKSTFYTLFKEHEAKVAEAEASRAKRSPQDVFRYEDAETGQSHYMTGEPGKAVEGGWTFTNPEGSYELVYKADAMGFQPEAAHIPIPVEDTNEVEDAKAKFYSLYDEHKAKVEAAIAEDAAAVVDARRKRSPNDVFRYEDEETGQSHYMTGEPGKAVEGGWTFTNPEGSYELVYKADEGGFQPEAAHIPVPVEDTNEVVDAKATFYSLYDEHKAKVEAAIAEDAAAVVDARRKREANHHHGFKFLPYHGYVHGKEEGEEPKEFKFLPYHGFVPADETVEGEEKLLEKLHPYHKKMTEKRFKLHPYHGFVPILENEPELKYHPYYGYIPAEEEPKEVKEFKFLPYHGFVPADKAIEGEEELVKNLHPYHQKMASKRFKLDPYYGFVPIMEEEEPAAVSERKKRDTETVEKSQDLIMPPHPYNFHPFLGLGAVKPEDSDNKLYKYIPYYGFVPAEKEDEEENEEENEEAVEGEDEEPTVLYKYDPLYGFVKADQEIKPLEEQEYKYTPYVGFVPVTGEEEDEDLKTYKFNPFYGFVEKTDEDKEATAEEMKDQQYKFVPFYGFVPVNEDGEIEETAKDYGNLKYTFHPYYGFLPTPTDGEDKTQLYKLDPVVGFYPSEKTEEVEEEVAELEAKRRKREAQYPLLGQHVFVHQPLQYVPLYPQAQKPVEAPARIATEEEKDEETEEEKPSVVPIAPLQQVVVQQPLGWRIPVAYPGIVPVTQVLPAATVPVTQVLPATQVIYPVQGQTMLPEDKFPVIPHAEDNNKPGPVIL